MALVNVSVKHGTTFDEAKVRLAGAVAEVEQKFGAAVRTVTWSPDRTAVTLSGPGVIVDLKIDAENVHATGDIPLLGKLLGSGAVKGLSDGIKGAVAKHFKRLPGS